MNGTRHLASWLECPELPGHVVLLEGDDAVPHSAPDESRGVARVTDLFDERFACTNASVPREGWRHLGAVAGARPA
jgi:hypothetical protein